MNLLTLIGEAVFLIISPRNKNNVTQNTSIQHLEAQVGLLDVQMLNTRTMMQLVQVYKIHLCERGRLVQGIHLQMEVEVVATTPLILVKCVS